MSSTRASAHEPAPILPSSLRARLSVPRTLARQDKLRLFLVGGAVRDLLLRRPVMDVDLVLEGDAARFARRVARASGGQARVYEKFGTATVTPADGSRLDLAGARRETYEKPGALPRVEPGRIEEDLARRDFTVNAMALEIAPSPQSRLLDPFGGRADLAKRSIRMLHPRSPVDDPTRAFRAVRYATRLNFRIERKTRGWMTAAIEQGAADAVSGARIRREIRLILSEPRRADSVRLLGDLGLTKTIHPNLRSDGPTRARLRTAERIAARHPGETTWLLFLLVWAADLPEKEVSVLAARLALEREELWTLTSWPRTRRQLKGLPRGWRRDSRLSANELVAAAALANGSDRAVLERALAAPAPRLTIQGRDLLAAGVPSGPAIGRALARTLSALRQGDIRPDQELDFALEAAREAMR